MCPAWPHLFLLPCQLLVLAAHDAVQRLAMLLQPLILRLERADLAVQRRKLRRIPGALQAPYGTCWNARHMNDGFVSQLPNFVRVMILHTQLWKPYASTWPRGLARTRLPAEGLGP